MMWFSYLKDQFFLEKEKVEQLLELDYEIEGIRIDFDYCIQFLEQNEIVKAFYTKFPIESSFILEGNPFCFMKLLHDYGMCSHSVIVLKNNYSFNRWILKKYEEFCKFYFITQHLSISIQDYFQIQSISCVLFGSQAFLNEMAEMIKIPCYFVLESALFYY